MKALTGLGKRIINSNDGRAVISNFGYLSLLQISGFVFPLITIPYLAHVLGVEGLGKIAFALAINTWLQTISTWGFNYTATRDVARVKMDLRKVSTIFSYVLWARLLLTLMCGTLLVLSILIIPYINELKTVVLITFLLVPTNIILSDWFFQAMEKMIFITIFSFATRVFFTVSIFFVITEKDDYIYQPLILVAGNLVCGLAAVYVICSKWKVKIIAPNLKNILTVIKKGNSVFINSAAPNLYNSFSVILLGFWGGTISNGLFDSGKKFSEIVNKLIQLISRVFFPLLSRKPHFHKFYLMINLSVSGFSSLSLFLLAPYLINLFFPKEFSPAIEVLQILSVSLFFLTLSNIYGVNYLVINGYEKELRNITIIASLIGFFASLPLIYFYDYLGAAMTICVSRALLGSFTTIKARKLQSKMKNI